MVLVPNEKGERVRKMKKAKIALWTTGVAVALVAASAVEAAAAARHW
jgi:hypothetical protein